MPLIHVAGTPRPSEIESPTSEAKRGRGGVLVAMVLSLSLLATLSLPGDSLQGAQRREGQFNRLAPIQSQYEKNQEKFRTALEKLAKECDDANLIEPAALIRAKAKPFDPQRIEVDPLPSKTQPDIPISLPEAERKWKTQLRFHQKEYARNLYLLSRRALNAGYPSFAFQLVRETAVQDPDHRSARRILGFILYGDEWFSPYDASMTRRGYVWSNDFGWILKSHLPRYEKGERYYGGRWISAEKEAEIRRDFDKAWQIRTAHFLVKTNHSQERGVLVASKLENYYNFLMQTFAGFFNTPDQLQKLFDGAGSGFARTATNIKPYEVHYYRSQEEYITRLKRKVPQIAITNGLYITSQRTAYYFYSKDEKDSTIYHEATHQILYESGGRDRAVAENRNFWIVEGVSCYMESFQHVDGRYSLGNPKYDRFHAARYRLLHDKYYVPLEKFARMGIVEFQNDPNISKNYSQASGLSHFFMHYENGKYREAFIAHLMQLYQGRKNAQPLDELTGVDFETLDREYADHTQKIENASRGDD